MTPEMIYLALCSASATQPALKYTCETNNVEEENKNFFCL